MTTKPNDGGPAFPFINEKMSGQGQAAYFGHPGMSLRAFGAFIIAAGWRANEAGLQRTSPASNIATLAIADADAIIRKLEES